MMKTYFCALLLLCISSIDKMHAQGENCTNPIILTDLNNWCSADNAYVTNPNTSGYGKPNCWASLQRETWFQFTAVADYVNVRIYGINNGGTLQRPEVVLYAGSCGGTITEIKCAAAPNAIHYVELFQSVVVGQTYYIRVDGVNGATVQKDFRLCINNFNTTPEPGQDCGSGTLLCTQQSISLEFQPGGGFNPNEASGSCLDDGFSNSEGNSVWLKWECGTSGTLTFDITPTKQDDDLDWVLFELTSGINSCNRTRLRCNATAHQGPTGLNLTDNDINELLGFGGVSADRRYNQAVNMVAGKAYALLINNWTAGQDGFILDFGTDPSAGGFKDINADFEVARNCVNNEVVFTDNSTNAVQYDWNFGAAATPSTENTAGPHTVSYPTGNHTAVLTITDADGCVDFEYVNFDVPITPPNIGTFANDVGCTVNNDGSITVTVTGGTPPFQYVIDGVYTAPTNATSHTFNNLTANSYIAGVRDDNLCQVETSVTVSTSPLCCPSPPVSGNETYTGCQGDGYDITVNGTLYNEANPTGSETLTGAASNGCDSVVNVSLTYNPNSTPGSETYIGCQGDGYDVTVNGTLYNEANPTGSETFVGAAFNGCDSMVNVSLTFNSSPTPGNETYTGCQGDGYDVTVNGTLYNEANPTGSETLTGAAFNGCDSMVNVSLTFNANPAPGNETYVGCQGDGYDITVNGTLYNEANPTGAETLTGAAFNGCDSMVNVSLTYNPNPLPGNETYTGCQGDGYDITVNGTLYNEANPTGSETLVGAAFNGCDSMVNVSLTYNPNSTPGSETYIGCQGDGYDITVNGTLYNEANPVGSETFVGAAFNGCDSMVNVSLTFNSSPTPGNETYTGCQGDGYDVTVNGTLYNEANPVGSETFVGAAFNGCDSMVNVSLTFNANPAPGNETYVGCQGDGYDVTVNGTLYNEANPTGAETLTGAAFNGCDSMVNVSLTFNANPAPGNETYTGCQGDGYDITVNGTLYNEANPTGSETLLGAAFNGCDSMVNVSLTFNPNSTPGSETYIGCQGDGYDVTVNGTLYNEANPVGSETLTGAAFNGCDSMVNVSLTFNPNSTPGNETYTGCQGDGYDVTVNGTLYNEANPVGSETLAGAAFNGCDSIVNVNLTFNANPAPGNETYTGCQGDGYDVTVNGTLYNEANPVGSETFVGAAFNGCDSMVNVVLTYSSCVCPPVTFNETYTGCQGDGYNVTVNGTLYNEANPAGAETFMGTSANGCDSIVTISLIFNASPTPGNETYTGCQGDGYDITVNGTLYNEANPVGSETLVGAAFNGCDSMVIVSLTFNASPTSGNETYTGCQGDGYDVTVNGTLYNEANPIGSETLVGAAFNGCDSMVNVNLTFNASPTAGNETYTGCQGDGYDVTVNGTLYNEANPNGSETFVGAAFNGCDSMVNVSLIFNASPSPGAEIYTGCQGDGYDVTVNGTLYNEANPVGSETLVGAAFNGCDSMVNVVLTFSSCVCPPVTFNETYTGCQGDGYNVTVNGTLYNEMNPAGAETFMGTSANGCDSIVTISLIFNASPTPGNENYTGCQGDGYDVTVNGTLYNEANPVGSETLTGAAFNGCDSVVNISLTFNASPTPGNETYTGCQGDGYDVTVNGTLYNEPNPVGSETFAGAAFNGCDSMVNIILTFNNCGCPSVTYNETYSGCQGDGHTVMVNGVTYDEANPVGSETFVGASANGCDSIVNINLTFNANPTPGNETYTGCQGDGYDVTVNGTLYNEANPVGSETFAGAAFNGCDSMVNIVLTFNNCGCPSVTYNENYTGCMGDGHTVTVNGVTYDEANPIGSETFVGASANGCDSIVNVSLIFNANPTPGNETYTGCQGDGYDVTVNGTLYNEANPVGSETFAGAAFNGCDSMVNVVLTFNNCGCPSVTFNENYTGCMGDGHTVMVNGVTYDEANPIGSETFVGASANGCDSIVNVSLIFNANPTPGNETYTGCQGDGYDVTVNGTLYNEANPVGSETFAGAAFNGCDSMVNVVLTFNNCGCPSVTYNENYTGCMGDGHTVMVNGVTYDEANPVGSETFAGASANGCDSIVNIALTFLPPGTSSYSIDLCMGESHTLPSGTVVSNPDVYPDVIPGFSCDSIITVTVNVGSFTSEFVEETLCFGESYQLPNGTFVDSAGIYKDTIPLPNTCGQILTITITMSEFQIDGISAVNVDCNGVIGNADIQTSGGLSPIQYEITDSFGNVTFADSGMVDLAAGGYMVIANDANGCTDTSSFEIGMDSTAAFTILPGDTSIFFGESVHLNASPSTGIFDWFPIDFLSCNDCPNPTTFPTYSSYYIIDRDDDGCFASDTIYIEVRQPEVFIPSAFSPNGDNNNDILFVLDDLVKELLLFEVYNRWGELMFSTSNISEGWDGFFRNDEQEIDTYIYHLKLIDITDKEHDLSGSVLLLR